MQVLGGIKVVAQRVASVGTGVTLKTLDDGWSLKSVASGPTRTLETDVVVQRTSDAPFTLRIVKGYSGGTVATITDTTSASARPVGTWRDAVHSATDPSNTVSVPLTGQALFGTHDLALAKADNRKLVMAFYYPWWSTYSDATFADQPSAPRSVWSPEDVDAMTSQARANGIDGFVSRGPEKRTAMRSTWHWRPRTRPMAMWRPSSRHCKP